MLSQLINLAEQTRIPIAGIKTDGGTQMRAALDEATVQEYLDAMQPAGWGAFPPVIVYYDGASYWLADGFHRIEAYRRAAAALSQPADVPAEVRSGTRRDAILHAAGANASHGLRRTNADKRRAVETLLRDEDWRTWSDREIARRCNVDPKTVGDIRRSLTVDFHSDNRTYTTKHGTTATMQTANIGARAAAPEPAVRTYASGLPVLNLPHPAQFGQVQPPAAAPTHAAAAAEDESAIDEPTDAYSATQPPPAARPHVTYNSGNNEWYTPTEYIEAARAVLGVIELDPASSVIANELVCADLFYTVEDDGLAQHWQGRTWLNPPYSGDLVGKFAAKLVAHVQDGDISEAIVLVNNATETAWFQELVSAASAVVFPRGRLRFWKPDSDLGAPLQGQAFIYFGGKPQAFLMHFKPFGWGARIV